MNLEANKTETTEEKPKDNEVETPEGKLDKPLEDKTSDNDTGEETLSSEGEELKQAKEGHLVLMKDNAALQVELIETQDKLTALTKKVELMENNVLPSKLELALEFYLNFKGDILQFKRAVPGFFVENEFGTNTDTKKEDINPYRTVEAK